MNIVIFAGYVGKDPEVREVNRSIKAQFSVADTRRYKGRDGERKEETTWATCEAWGKTAELIEKYVRKGSFVVVHGRLHVNEYEKDGKAQKFTVIVIENLQFGGERPAGNGRGESRGEERSRPEGRTEGRPASEEERPRERPGVGKAPGTKFDDFEDDIPF